MYKALDSAKSLMDMGSDLLEDGITDVFRYVFRESGFKDLLTKPELDHLEGMGINVHPVFEDGYPTEDAYFTSAKGSEDGAFFTDYCFRVLELPHGRVLWMTADYDPSIEAINLQVSRYFRQAQFKVKYGMVQNGVLGAYLLGVYGSGLLLSKLGQWGIISHTWLAQSTGYQGYDGFKPSANVVQMNEGQWRGLDVDWDVVRGI
jgi:Domain of unknown function (DUF1906)